jgi:hypothetical protein
MITALHGFLGALLDHIARTSWLGALSASLMTADIMSTGVIAAAAGRILIR